MSAEAGIHAGGLGPHVINLQQYGEAFADFIEQLFRACPRPFYVSFFPGHAAQLIDQHDARDGMVGSNGDLKRVTSRAACDRAREAKARPHIVLSRCQHDGWAMATLLVAKRGIEIDPNEVAGIATVVTSLRCQQAVPN